MDDIRTLIEKLAARPRARTAKEIARHVVSKMHDSDKTLKLAACNATKKAIKKMKKATIVKMAQGFESGYEPEMLDPETEAEVAQHNVHALRQAGGILGAGAGALGGAGVGAGAGLLAAKALKRTKGGPIGALVGLGAGGLAGGILGPQFGERAAPRITAQDLENMNQTAIQESMALGLDPELARYNLLKFHGQLGPKGSYELNPYLNMPE